MNLSARGKHGAEEALEGALILDVVVVPRHRLPAEIGDNLLLQPIKAEVELWHGLALKERRIAEVSDEAPCTLFQILLVYSHHLLCMCVVSNEAPYTLFQSPLPPSPMYVSTCYSILYMFAIICIILNLLSLAVVILSVVIAITKVPLTFYKWQ